MKSMFSDDFVQSLKVHASVKNAVKKKVDMILANPVGMGEPLKANFRGYYSSPVKRTFIVIYLYCMICRQKGDDQIVRCHDCHDCLDETVKFVLLGPDDQAYKNR